MGVPGLWNALREAGVPRSLTSIAVVDGFQSASASSSASPTSTSSSTSTTSSPTSNPSPNPEPHPRAFRIGIDASIWFVHAEYGKEGENPELRTIFFRLTKLLQVPYLPLFVFDGPLRPAMKRGKLIDTKPNWMIEGLKGMIEAFGFEWRTAPGEAEAELAYLNRIGVIDAVLTDDVDTLVFGARFVIRNQSKNLSGNRAHDLTNADGRDDKNHTMTFSAEDIAGHPNISLDTPSLILIALLSGGDYSPGIPGLGISVSASLAQSGFGRSLVEKVQSLSLSISLGLQSSSSSSSNGGTSGSRKPKTSKTRVTLGTSEKEELLTWLESWREELCAELRTNSRGFLKKRMPTLASRIEREKWVPDLQVLMAYVCPVTSEERAVAKALLSLHPSSSSPLHSSSEVDKVVERAKKQIAQELRNQYIWKHDPDIGAIARVCEDRFEWGVREVILKRFRSWLWVGVVCRMLRRASINLDLTLGGGGSGGGGEGEGRGRSSTPGPSSQRTETAKRLESLVMSSPRKGTSRRPLPLSHSPDDSDFDSNPNSNEGGKVILKIHSSRTHASTDGLLEYRLEVDPSSFVRAVEEGIEGKRSVARTGWTDSEDEGGGGGGSSDSGSEGPKKTGKKGGKGGKKTADAAPTDHVRMWMPACMVERVVPGLVRDFEERCAKKSSKSKASSATKASTSSTTAKGKGKGKAPARAKSTTAIPSSSQLSSTMAMIESSDEEEDDSVPMPVLKPKPRPKVRKAATAPSGGTSRKMEVYEDDGGEDEDGFEVDFEREVEREKENEILHRLPSRPAIRAAAPPEPMGMGMAGYFKASKPGTSSQSKKPAISTSSIAGTSTSSTAGTSTSSTARTSTSTEKKKQPVGSSTARVASLFDDPEVQIFRDLTSRKDRFAPSTFKPKPAPPPPPPAPARKAIAARTKPVVTSSLGYIEISSDEDVPPKPTQTTRPALRRIEEDVIDLCSTDSD